MTTKDQAELGPKLIDYFINRLDGAMESNKALAPAELNAMTKAYESGILGRVFHGSEEKSPSGELEPTANINFQSKWLQLEGRKDGNGMVAATKNGNGAVG